MVSYHSPEAALSCAGAKKVLDSPRGQESAKATVTFTPSSPWLAEQRLRKVSLPLCYVLKYLGLALVRDRLLDWTDY